MDSFNYNPVAKATIKRRVLELITENKQINNDSSWTMKKVVNEISQEYGHTASNIAQEIIIDHCNI